MRPFVFVTHKLPDAALGRLREYCDFAVGTERGQLSRDLLLSEAGQASGLICLLTDRVDEEFFKAAPHLRIVANVAVGYNNIDLEAARQRGIYVTNTPGVLTEATADLTWALILAVTRRVVEADIWVRAGNFKSWDFDLFPGFGLNGKTLGIIGYGRIGRAVARRATGFGMQVLYCGRNEIAFRDDPPLTVPRTGMLHQPLNDSARIGGLQDGLTVRRTEFRELLAQSDIISVHVPLTATTRHLIDQTAIARLKSSAYFINTSRGEIADERALTAALLAGKLAGAGLDVYEHEPQITPELMTLPNVVLLPHIGSATRDTRLAMAMTAVENIIDVMTGREPRNLLR